MKMRLKELRRRCGVTQNFLADMLQIEQSALSKFENQDDALISTLSRYVTALGGTLVIDVQVGGEKYTISQFKGKASG